MNLIKSLLIILLVFVSSLQSEAQETSQTGHEHHSMMIDADGVVMNENRSELPRNCKEISHDYQFTIHAGRDYASGPASTIYGMSQHELKVQACSRLEVTFVNEDSVRHQWMIHGLPKYLYPAGMFHIEVAGGKQKTGILIVPGDDQTYLIHCDLAQHMEKGMRGQLVVGAGSGDLWGIPEISNDFQRSAYLPHNTFLLIFIALIVGVILVLLFQFGLKATSRET